MKFTLDTTNYDRVEFHISPPMSSAITLPILIDGKHSPFAIYIATAFTEPDPPGLHAIVNHLRELMSR